MALTNGYQANGNGALHYPIGNGRADVIGDSDRAALELLRYWNLLWRRRWLLGGIVLAVTLAVGLVTRFYCRKWYRAEAVITPLGPGEEADSGLSDSPFEGVAGISALLGIGAAGDNVVAAERFVAIMESYDFDIDLIQRHNLVPLLTQKQAFSGSPEAPTPWRLHLQLNSRFNSEYDYRTGNLTLYFMDPDRVTAQRILAYYLERLRDRLRNEAVREASTASQSLAEEVAKTPDALLQNQLYELMARQIQREKLAQVQADFAFKIVEPPVVPDHYYAPVARTRAALSGFIVMLLLTAWAIVDEWLRAANASLAALTNGHGVTRPLVMASGEGNGRGEDRPVVAANIDKSTTGSGGSVNGHEAAS
ncbi:MAG TPA: Wzz/FepE/Etk N-terminal domain-containing protein [Candidatus Binataceae bacterium]|nr:Wzz/FepE/Etk N-terminal domain-containing protein [Candidatus Binataceae bacterium]